MVRLVVAIGSLEGAVGQNVYNLPVIEDAAQGSSLTENLAIFAFIGEESFNPRARV